MAVSTVPPDLAADIRGIAAQQLFLQALFDLRVGRRAEAQSAADLLRWFVRRGWAGSSEKNGAVVSE
jgi:hypothetical protein